MDEIRRICAGAFLGIAVGLAVVLLSGCHTHFHYHAPSKITSPEQHILDQVLEELANGQEEN